ncbi:MAG: polyketide cyclase [Acidobacteria bacterium 13_2_20CM_58_27]|nr:MAG: polyketide cyclase [Acidobacteria bacterium 13_2_20CM_58_27]
MATNGMAFALWSLTFLAGLMPSVNAQSLIENPPTPPPPHEKQAPAVEKNLKVFDTLDFDVFSNQKWDRLKESHALDIVVTWPDGHETKGIERHIEDLKALFVFAPDLEIKVHPIRFGSGTWTAVSGVMSGTFIKPMATPDGKSIPPTGKHFALSMVTIGHWKGSTMDHEWLFWDNQDFMNQIGLGK